MFSSFIAVIVVVGLVECAVGERIRAQSGSGRYGCLSITGEIGFVNESTLAFETKKLPDCEDASDVWRTPTRLDGVNSAGSILASYSITFQ